MGILMASNKVTEQQAFDLLRIASQSNHRKLHDVAYDVVQTGELDVPEPPEERHRD
jgi:AmiR/NasT family two-component response regulator